MAGVYIHIPFCKQQCSYCDFHFSTTFQKYRDRMLSAMSKEIISRSDALKDKEVETIYFGGGTPSLLNKSEIERFLSDVRTHFQVSQDVEITLEANPDDCTLENLTDWKSLGINRLSIGIQSFKSSDLAWMNRAHTAEEAEKCVLLAQSVGIENITVDLIYGLPNLTASEWQNHIQKVIDWGVPHISSYCLTVESNTLLEKKVNKGELKVATDDEESRQFEALVALLNENGIVQYTISNFAKPGFESKHNSNYWKGVHYLGIGPSAHSFFGNIRRWNIANNAQYMKGLEDNSDYFETEELSKTDQFNEYILTGLRTVYGVSIPKLERIQSLTSSFHVKTEEFIANGWMEKKDDTLILTVQGRLRADFIASELFAT